MKINILLNGVSTDLDVRPGEFLAGALRRHGVFSVRIGCDESNCGACTVLFDDKPVLSCGLLAMKADGHRITTVEGISDEASRLYDCFAREGADQCGFCNAGLAVLAYAMKMERRPSWTDDEIKHYIVGNLCRCTGYLSQLKAIRAYLEGGKGA